MPAISDTMELKLAVRTDIVGECLQVTALINNQKISSSIYYLQEQAIRDALIKLGWTPPQEKDERNYV